MHSYRTYAHSTVHIIQPFSSVCFTHSVVAPLVESFTFPKNLTRGKRLRVICTVTEGDRPLDVEWHRDGARVVPTKNVHVKRIDEYTSLLGISYLETEHAGNYSCVASNAVAKFAKSAVLVIRGKKYYAILLLSLRRASAKNSDKLFIWPRPSLPPSLSFVWLAAKRIFPNGKTFLPAGSS